MIPIQETGKKTPEPPYSLQNLGFYFDAVEQDRLDRGVLSRKSGQIMSLREKLMTLPEPEFETTVKTIAKFVDTLLPGALEKQNAKAALPNQIRKEALQVFERATEASFKTSIQSEKIARVS